jgi:hypothetical protein
LLTWNDGPCCWSPSRIVLQCLAYIFAKWLEVLYQRNAALVNAIHASPSTAQLKLHGDVCGLPFRTPVCPTFLDEKPPPKRGGLDGAEGKCFDLSSATRMVRQPNFLVCSKLITEMTDHINGHFWPVCALAVNYHRSCWRFLCPAPVINLYSILTEE